MVLGAIDNDRNFISLLCANRFEVIEGELALVQHPTGNKCVLANLMPMFGPPHHMGMLDDASGTFFYFTFFLISKSISPFSEIDFDFVKIHIITICNQN